METLLEKLESKGYNKDIEISKEEFESFLPDMKRTNLSLAGVRKINEKTYRDSRKTRSLELKDCSSRDIDQDYLAELEHYNPRFRPVLHLLVDFPLWLWRNRIKEVLNI